LNLLQDFLVVGHERVLILHNLSLLLLYLFNELLLFMMLYNLLPCFLETGQNFFFLVET